MTRALEAFPGHSVLVGKHRLSFALPHDLFWLVHKAFGIVTNAALQSLGRQPLALPGCADTIRPFHRLWLWLLS